MSGRGSPSRGRGWPRRGPSAGSAGTRDKRGAGSGGRLSPAAGGKRHRSAAPGHRRRVLGRSASTGERSATVPLRLRTRRVDIDRGRLWQRSAALRVYAPGRPVDSARRPTDKRPASRPHRGRARTVPCRHGRRGLRRQGAGPRPARPAVRGRPARHPDRGPMAGPVRLPRRTSGRPDAPQPARPPRRPCPRRTSSSSRCSAE